MKRVDIIRSGNDNNHRAVRAALDVEWLRVNVARDRPIEVQVADQIGRIARRECGIDIKTIPRGIIVFLRDVELRVGSQNGSAANSNEKRKFHSREIDNPRPFYNSTLTVCQGFTAAQWWCKSNGVVIFVFGRTREARGLSRNSSAPRQLDIHCVLRKRRALLHTRV